VLPPPRAGRPCRLGPRPTGRRHAYAHNPISASSMPLATSRTATSCATRTTSSTRRRTSKVLGRSRTGRRRRGHRVQVQVCNPSCDRDMRDMPGGGVRACVASGSIVSNYATLLQAPVVAGALHSYVRRAFDSVVPTARCRIRRPCQPGVAFTRVACCAAPCPTTRRRCRRTRRRQQGRHCQRPARLRAPVKCCKRPWSLDFCCTPCRWIHLVRWGQRAEETSACIG
jgi:hypothetical protein